jgi:hypothetical protein
VRLLRRIAVAEPSERKVISTSCRSPRLGETVCCGKRLGTIDTVIRHEESVDQVRVKWSDEFYRHFYDWSALTWERDHWEMK